MEVLHFEPLSRSLVEGLKFVRAAIRLPLVNNVGDEVVLGPGLPIPAKETFFLRINIFLVLSDSER